MKLALHDAHDVEGLVRSIINRTLNGWGATLSYHDQEDLRADLMARAWRLSLMYRPEMGLKFTTFATRILERRIVDWYRKRFGDTRYGTRPTEQSIHDLLDLEDDLTASRRTAIVSMFDPDEKPQTFEEVEQLNAIAR